MAGYFVFAIENPDIGLSTGDVVAVGSYLDIITDTLYYTDGSNIFEWEGDTTLKTYTWRSAKMRMPRLVNLGAALVEANSYLNLTFKLYAGGVLKHTETVSDGDPFRLPGGYLSNIYEIELIGTDVVTGVSIAETVFDLAEG